MDFIDIAIIGKYHGKNPVESVDGKPLFVYNEFEYELFMYLDQDQFLKGKPSISQPALCNRCHR